MIALTGYQITVQLYEGNSTIIYRGIRDLDRLPVIVKLLTEPYPTLKQLGRLKQEYAIPQSLQSEGVIQSLSLETYQNGLALIMEDFGGQSLAQYLSERQLAVPDILKIAIQIAGILNEIHQAQILHKDINPKNIIINPTTGQVKITDFSIASRLSNETPTLETPNLLEGTLAYIAPEQTGRMNRAIDYRSDYYSLGVTLYQMLVGELPFPTQDPMEVVHAHIAKPPIPPHQVKPEIPEPLSHIVLKLLAKNAEDRYQTGRGLKFDLETCLLQLESTGKIENFIPGQRDFAGQFSIPQKLYGRETEVATLMDAFARCSGGSTEMMLVSGYSGIGKTSVINEIHKPIVKARGYFIAGKFDQYKRNIPYASLIQAFESLMEQLLAESAERLTQWREKLLAALESNGQIIIDVIPAVELIIGQQPAVPQLGSTESQNRFNRVFQQFIRVFGQPEHPLVIFLDDLQWADSASLKLIELLITDADSKYLLFIGAYRDNEVDSTHPLMQTLAEIRSAGAVVNAVNLEPLKQENVSELAFDTLRNSQEIPPLAELLFAKSRGNPFFLTQFLKTLYREQLLVYDLERDRWRWNLEDIQAVGITDNNAVELVVRTLHKLPIATQQVLQWAACIGNIFDLEVLALVNEAPPGVTAMQLWAALQEGWILPLSAAYKIPLAFAAEELVKFAEESKVAYKFLHDRVQQAAYSLIPEERKKATHLKIGQLLLQNTPDSETDAKIFDIVNQLNLAVELIEEPGQRAELLRLNTRAGQKAKAATAYEPAVNYLHQALLLLPAAPWETEYELTLNLYLEAAEAYYLSTNYVEAERLAAEAGEQAQTLSDKVKVYELQIQIYQAQNAMIKALETGLEALDTLGISLSNPPADGREWVKLPSLADLDNYPVMSEPQQLVALRILMNISPIAYIAKPELLALIILTMVNLCIEKGHSAVAAYAYAFYGVLLCGPLQDIESGYHSGQLGLKLLEQFNAKPLKSQVYHLFNAHIRYWKEHIRESISSFIEGIKSGLETGSLQWSSYSATVYCNHIFWAEQQLELVCQKQTEYIQLMEKIKQSYGIYHGRLWNQVVLNLMGEARNKRKLSGSAFDEDDMLPILIEANNVTIVFALYVAKSLINYVFKDFETALNSAYSAETYAAAGIGLSTFAIHNFYDSLSALARYSAVNTEAQQQYLERVAANQEKLGKWAQHAPSNFQHKYDLVAAEQARVLGNALEAMALYDRAIAGAREQRYLQEEAIAYERAAEFYHSLGREEIAQTYMKKAHYCYTRWGATAKVEDLELEYPYLGSRLAKKENGTASPTITTTSTTGSSSGEFLDIATVLKASQAIFSALKLDKLLVQLIALAIENAGAQKGFLILAQGERLTIEAAKDSTGEVLLLQSLPLDNALLPETIVNYVARTQQELVLSDATREGIFTHDAYVTEKQPRSILCSAIVNQGKLIGIIYLENNLTPGAFTQQRLQVVKVIAAQAAISIENAQLYHTLEAKVEERTAQLAQANQEITLLNERLKADNLRMAAELDVTRRLQKMMLPKDEELREIPGLEIAGFMEPADEVGGDYYDVLPYNGGAKIGIGDVTGHGLESGMLMIMAQTAVRTLLESEESDPTRFLDILNRTIYKNVQRMNSDKNMTLAILDYQAGTGNLSLSGQHEEAIVVRAGGAIERIDTMDLGFPLGLDTEISEYFAQMELQLNPGDGVVLYTDGITEAPNVDNVEYGIERLCQVISENWQHSAEQIRQAAIDDLRRHIGAQNIYDDITLVVIKQK